MIREANIDDISELIRMGLAFHSALDNGMPLIVSDFIETVGRMLVRPEAVILVNQNDEGRLDGSIAGVLYNWFVDKNLWIVHESWWWVDPEVRGKGPALELYKALETWAKGKEAGKLVMVDFLGNVGGLYKRKGFKRMETRYVKDL